MDKLKFCYENGSTQTLEVFDKLDYFHILHEINVNFTEVYKLDQVNNVWEVAN